jgi:predicted secreted Zn-dependent protease
MLAILAAAAARADVTESVSYRSYDVRPSGGQTLAAAVNAATPIHEDGRSMAGHTTWHVWWHFTWHRATDGSCAIDTVHCDVTAEITLPQLESGDQATRERFQTFLAALEVHERGHVRIAEAAARDVEDAIRALPAAPDCASLDREANEAGQRVLARSRSDEVRYDQDTQHGRTQGAWLRQ